MIHLALTYAVAALLVAIGAYGVLARRNAVLVLIGIELILAGAGLLLVTTGAVQGDRWQAGNVLTLFVITIAAAEVVVALAVIVALFRRRAGIDLTEPAPAIPDPDDPAAGPTPRATPQASR